MLINEIEEQKGLSMAYVRLRTICNKIYIARNISQDNQEIIKQLEEIDKLFRDTEGGN